MNVPDGLRRRHPAEAKESTNFRRDSSADDASRQESKEDFIAMMRSEVKAALDDSLRSRKGDNKNKGNAYQDVEGEIKRMFQSVDEAQTRDDESQSHNRKLRTKQSLVSILGFFCLVCPALIVFDSFMSFIPHEDIEVLEYASQQRTLFGTTSRFCLTVLRTAEKVRMVNDETKGSFIWGCFGALSLLLLWMRFALVRQKVLSDEQREQLQCIRLTIREQLEIKKNDSPSE